VTCASRRLVGFCFVDLLVPFTSMTCAVLVFDRSLHSRMPLDPTHVRLKLCHACDQWHYSSRESPALTVTIIHYVERLLLPLPSYIMSKHCRCTGALLREIDPAGGGTVLAFDHGFCRRRVSPVWLWIWAVWVVWFQPVILYSKSGIAHVVIHGVAGG
jgi:hypothetical protein